MHVIFYDGECPLCNRAVRFVGGADKKQIFYFAPLNGVTAHSKLSHLRLKHPDLDTLVLLQDYETAHEQLLIEGKAALRILWLLGGAHKILGALSFLPSPLFDLIYRFVARRRYRLFSHKLPLDTIQDRFLP